MPIYCLYCAYSSIVHFQFSHYCIRLWIEWVLYV